MAASTVAESFLSECVEVTHGSSGEFAVEMIAVLSHPSIARSLIIYTKAASKCTNRYYSLAREVKTVLLASDCSEVRASVR